MRRFFNVFLLAVATALLPSSFVSGQDFLKQLEEQLQKQRQKKSENQGSGSKSSTKSEQPPQNDDQPSSSPFGWDLFGGVNASEKGSEPQQNQNPSDISRSSRGSSRNQNGEARPRPAVPSPERSGRSATEPRPSGYLGMVAEQPAGGGLGLTVVEIDKNSPAFLGGFKINDRLLSVDGYAIGTIDDFAERLFESRIGVPIKFLVNRNGENIELTAVLQDRDTARRLRENPRSGANANPPISGVPSIAGTSLGRPNFGVIAYDLGSAFRKQFGIRAYRGAAIAEVAPDSPAAEAGLVAGDCVVSVNSTVIQGVDDLRKMVEVSTVGDLLRVSFYRGQQLLDTDLILTALPENVTSPRPIFPSTSNPPVGNRGTDGWTGSARRNFSRGTQSNRLQPDRSRTDGQSSDPDKRDYIRSLENELIEVRRELLQTQRQLAEMQRRVLELEARR